MDNNTPDSFPAQWPRVWRGESSGEMFRTFDAGSTLCGVGFFFAHREDHAAQYAGRGTQPRPFVLDPGRTLDLRDVYHPAIQDPQVREVLEAVRGAFDGWTDRYSGEPMDLMDFLDAGTLYDYEGTGSAERWNRLFKEARAAGFDSVVALDHTDGVGGEDAWVWVVFDPERIHFLSPSPCTEKSVEPVTNGVPSPCRLRRSPWR